MIYKKLILLILISLSLTANTKITSFSKSKRILKKIYRGHQVTFYADCNYNYKDKKNMIVRKSCGY